MTDTLASGDISKSSSVIKDGSRDSLSSKQRTTAAETGSKKTNQKKRKKTSSAQPEAAAVVATADQAIDAEVNAEGATWI